MRALVTGAAGFLGSHLCDYLLEQGHYVCGIDNMANGKKQNLFQANQRARFDFHRDDVTNLSKIGLFSEGFDWIFHLAALADIVPSIRDPLSYHSTNVNGTVAMLQMAKTFKVKKFIYAASSSCYGIPKTYPTSEACPTDPKYPYALTKLLGEQCVMHWGKVYKIPAISLRLFNVFGPRAKASSQYGAVFGVFLSQIANGSPLTIVGDGTQSRDFTYVSDVVKAFYLAAKSDVQDEIFNVSSGGTVTISELANQLGGKLRVFVPKRPGEPDVTYGDSSKIRQALGWKPEVSFSQGVAEMRNRVSEFKSAPLWTEKSIAHATKEWFESLS